MLSAHTRSLIPLLIAVALSTSAAAKCNPEIEALEAKVGAATTIVVAQLQNASAEWNDSSSITVTANYVTLELLKGQSHSSGSVGTSLTTAGMELTPGLTYLFFLYGDSEVGFCGGSKRLDWYKASKAGLTHKWVEEELEILSEIRELVGDNPT
ncbi:hypothetical protein [Haliea sp.]|uniref:hypothetical protein n=1 Tax=Haliea sp. TaxID=1932666 RepID=UPI0025B7DF29|nr:hypothetical protein [Haliea sp.]|tara:strand:+ start:1169 stop:1630 length:462 start_codon:yes stop_codon:yes gene_type:complete